MEVAPLSHIKQELKHQSPARLIELCLHMAKFSKDNKEMLNYLLFETGNEEQYRQDIKQEITEMFEYVDHYSVYFAKKTLRKILRFLKKHMAYTISKRTEVELQIHFCLEMRELPDQLLSHPVVFNIVKIQSRKASNMVAKMDEDIQFDYKADMEKIEIAD
jgi:hypothetical protein